jgi:hypothetical protein
MKNLSAPVTSLLALLVLTASASASPVKVAAQGDDAVTTNLDAAVTFVEVFSSDDMSAPAPTTGTAFCIRSDATYSYFLTAEHVVQGSTHLRLTRYDPDAEVLPNPMVFREGPNSDLAVIRVARGYIHVIRLDPTIQAPTSPIESAGFPASIVALINKGTIAPKPSYAIGTVQNFYKTDDFMLFGVDGDIEHGSSGGPLLKPGTDDAVGVVVSKDENPDKVNYALAVLPVVKPFLIASNMGSLIQNTVSNPIAGSWQSTGQFSASTNFGGPPYCYYSTRMRVESLTLAINSSGVTSAFLQAGMDETLVPPCPYPAIPANDQLFDLISGAVTGNSVDLAFRGKPGNEPLTNAQFHGTLDATGMLQGEVIFHRVDSAPTLNWTVPISVALSRT